jgi:group I intron endonuclease
MSISKALLNYGYSNFTLEILEYCDYNNVRLREQHYIYLLKPEYNILKIAGSSLGFTHSLETIAKFKTRNLTPKQKAKLLEHLKNHNSSKEQREKSR